MASMASYRFSRSSTQCDIVRLQELRGAPIKILGPNHNIGETDTSYWFRVPLPDILDNDDISLTIQSSGGVMIYFISPAALVQRGRPTIPTRGYFKLPGPVEARELSGQIANGFLECWVKKADVVLL